jgi:hypothetical protein
MFNPPGWRLLDDSDWEHAIPTLQEQFPDWGFERDWLS